MKYHHHTTLILAALLYVGPARADYRENAAAAITTLNDKWYDADTGLWGETWWESANMLETVARFGAFDSSFQQTAADVISNTYAKSANLKGATDWKNDYYDDMGWWALAWIASYDLTGDAKYLDTAKDLFQDMTGGWSTPCGGGTWWDKSKFSIAAISNELFLSVAAHLANRVDGDADKATYADWAQREWDWFWESGVINADGLINDGIDKTSCDNDGKTTYTYNQGVILGALSELARAKSDGGFIQHAHLLANASMTLLLGDDGNGILTEPVGDGPLDTQGSMFKGAYVRGLSTLNQNEPQQDFVEFLQRNADSAWERATTVDGIVTDRWQGGSSNTNVASHASGVDVLVAAALASSSS